MSHISAPYISQIFLSQFMEVWSEKQMASPNVNSLFYLPKDEGEPQYVYLCRTYYISGP